MKERTQAAKLDPQGFGICAAHTQKHTLVHKIHEKLDCVRGSEEDVEKSGSAVQPVATTGGCSVGPTRG